MSLIKEDSGFIVRKLINKIKFYSNLLDNLRDELEEENIKWQSLCNHDYVMGNDGDYHKIRVYYTCKKCNHVKN